MTKTESGLLLGDRFRLIRKIGRGGMGDVWVATDESLGVDVAVKLLTSVGGPEIVEEAKARFDAEQRVLAQLRSPYVVKIRDRGATEQGQPYFVMDLLQGRSLQQHLQQRGRLTVRESLQILEDVARGIQEPHSLGLIHRDLKPGNIFLLEYTGQSRLEVRILDFGIAKSLSEPASDKAQTAPGMMLGTPSYIAPEQIEGRATEASDVYALGVVVYRCLVGATPFNGDQVAVLSQHLAVQPPMMSPRLEVPEPLEALVRAMLQKEPSARPTASEVAILAEELRATLPRNVGTGEISIDLSGGAPQGTGAAPKSSPMGRAVSMARSDGGAPPAGYGAARGTPAGGYPRMPSSNAAGTPIGGYPQMPPPNAMGTPSGGYPQMHPYGAAFSVPLASPNGTWGPDTLSSWGSGQVQAPQRRWIPALLLMVVLLLTGVVGWAIYSGQSLASDEEITRTVALRVESRPMGARVLLGAADLGNTPLVANVDARSSGATLELRLDGYEPAKRQIPSLSRDLFMDFVLVEIEPEEEPEVAEPEAEPPARRTPVRRPARPAPVRSDPKPAPVVEDTPPIAPPKPVAPKEVRVAIASSTPVQKLKIDGRWYGGTPIRATLLGGTKVEVEALGKDGQWRKQTITVPTKDGAVIRLD